MNACCTDHECDDCSICRSGKCCGEQVVDANLPPQGGWHGKHHAPVGELLTTEDGKLVCHMCGDAWDYLARHVRSHGITADEYRAWFGLPVTMPLASEAWRASRKHDHLQPGGTPPVLTSEQRSAISKNREQRYGAMSKMARERVRTEEEKVKARKAKRKFDPGHHCPQCGAFVCTWTGRASGYSTTRTLCGERECLTAARSAAAIIANRKRWGNG